jgi:hypothetical protein
MVLGVKRNGTAVISIIVCCAEYLGAPPTRN